MGDDQLDLKILDGARPGEEVVVLEGVLNSETAFRFRDSVRDCQPPTTALAEAERTVAAAT
jgi:hypothetical protein